MSTIIMSTCWPLQGMSPAQKSVLISLADNANDEGVCWPSVKKIAVRTCLSERAVQGAIRWLVSVGLLTANERGGRSTVYHLTPAAYAPPQKMHPADAAPAPAASAPVPPQMLHPTPADAAPRTTIEPPEEPPKEPSKRKRAAPVPAKVDELVTMALPSWLPRASWVDWVEHRKKVKAPLTVRAAELGIAYLGDLRDEGNDPVKVINQSVRTGKWTDFYPLKNAAGQTQRAAPATTSQYDQGMAAAARAKAKIFGDPHAPR